MIIFWRLFLAHLIGDFTLQFDVVNRLKRNYWWGMLVHTGTHLALSVLLTWQYLGRTWFSFGAVNMPGWAALLCVFALHHLQDELRVFLIRRFHTPDNTLHFLWDQLVHGAVIFIFSPVIGFQCSGCIISEKMIALAACFVLVSHFTTVLVYFVDKDMYNDRFPSFDEKYFGIAMRAVLWLFFLLPGWNWLPYSALWLGYIAWLRWRRVLDFSHIGNYAGLAFTLCVGALSRYILFHM